MATRKHKYRKKTNSKTRSRKYKKGGMESEIKSPPRLYNPNTGKPIPPPKMYNPSDIGKKRQINIEETIVQPRVKSYLDNLSTEEFLSQKYPGDYEESLTNKLNKEATLAKSAALASRNRESRRMTQELDRLTTQFERDMKAGKKRLRTRKMKMKRRM